MDRVTTIPRGGGGRVRMLFCDILAFLSLDLPNSQSPTIAEHERKQPSTRAGCSRSHIPY